MSPSYPSLSDTSHPTISRPGTGQSGTGRAGPESAIPFREPRRRDRAIRDEAWIHDMLRRQPVGALATAGENGPSLVPNLFVFDPSENALFLHAAKTGRTREHIEARPRVAFCVHEMGRLLPSDAAVHFSVEYASVVVLGRASVVEDAAEAHRALGLFMGKYAPQFEPGRHYRDIEAKDLARTSVFRIDIESWSGKGKTSDAADAYEYASP